MIYNIGINVTMGEDMDSAENIYALAKDNNGVLTTADAVRAGVSRAVLSRLAQKGTIERIAYGRYVLPDVLPDELFITQQRSAKIIYSHETALFLHDLAERTPIQLSLTIPSNYKLSPALAAGCKVYYIKPDLYNLGKSLLSSKAGHEVVTYDAERTICDIIRSRSRIDNQAFAAALRNYAARKNQNWNRLSQYAEVFHITKLLRQYLGVLT